MKYLKQYIHKIIGLFLVFFPVFAFADGFKWSSMQSVFTPKATDLSVGFLSQIFGAAGGGLAAGGSSIMGELFGIFNSGLLTITGIVLAYVTVRSITDTAMDGEAMGKKMNHWVAIRVVSGVGLLAPKATGYSVLNSIVMWATLQGVGFADTLWDHALDYLAQGGVIYRNVTSSVSSGVASGVLDKTLVIGDKSLDGAGKESSSSFGASDVFRSLVCMYAVQNGVRKAQAAAKQDVDIDTEGHYYPRVNSTGRRALINYLSANISLHPVYERKYDPNGNPKSVAQVFFPGDGLKHNEGNIYCGGTNGDCYYFLGTAPAQGVNLPYLRECCSKIIDGEHNCMDCYKKPRPDPDPRDMCGAYTVTWDGGLNITQTDDSIYVAAKYAGLGIIIEDLQSVAEGYVIRETENKILNNNDEAAAKACLDSSTGCFSQEHMNSIAHAVINAGGEYQAAIEPARIRCSQASPVGGSYCRTGGAEDLRKVPSDVRNDGWVSAGRYYFDIASMTDTQIVWDQKNYKISVLNGKNPPFVSRLGDPSSRYGAMMRYLRAFLGFTIEMDRDFQMRLRWIIKDSGNPGDNVKGVEPKAVGFIKEINEALQRSSMPLNENIDASKSTIMNFPFQSTRVSSDMLTGSQVVLDPLSDALNAVYQHWLAALFDRDVFMSDTGVVWGTKSNATFPLLRIHKLGFWLMQDVVGFFNDMFGKFAGLLNAMYWKEMALHWVGAAAGPWSVAMAFWGVGVNYNTAVLTEHLIGMANVTLKVFVEIPIMVTLPMAVSVMMPLFVMGVTLAYYVPLIPFMLFTFGIISWLIFVIEAMVAAPIVALGITHPEGHDLLGKAEQAAMLLFSVFLRPAAMIIGLVAALILSFVALNVLNTGFITVITKMGMVDFGGGRLSSYFGAVVFVTVMMMYLLMILALMNQCFSLIHVVPEKVMRWLGMHPETGPEQGLMESVKGGMTPFSESGRGAAEGMGKLGAESTAMMQSKVSLPNVTHDKQKPPDKPASVTPGGPPQSSN